MHEWELPDYEPSLPVSEKSNPLTCDIDRAPASRIVRMLQSCDAEMFRKETGSTYQMLLGDKMVKNIMEVAEKVEIILKEPRDSLIVLSGCGTSGRLAFLVVSSFNRALRQMHHVELYSYIIAGGDRALFSSQEAPEDDTQLGVLSLKKVCEGKKRVLFIGISCGLSAPFVAGQLDFCLQHPDVYTPVLLGFNPTHQARNEPIPGCTFTFHSVLQRMQALAESQKAFLINPSVGPEAISGSSRMKGGSATKMLLEVILCAAHAAAFLRASITHRGILQHLRAYEKTVEITYSHSEAIAALVAAAGKSLLCGKRVCYLGWGSLAVLGLIDASECEPTFGAAYEDIQAFRSGGYRGLNNTEGSLALLGAQFCIAHEDFLLHVLPTLDDQDTVILIYAQSDDVSEVVDVAHRAREKTSNLHAVYHQANGNDDTSQDEINGLCVSTLAISWPSPVSGSLLHMWELSTKLVLNAVSTGAHVLKGKIYQNHMIDVQVTNSKLYRRATRLIQKLSGRPESQCEEALLMSIYQVENLTEDIRSCDVTTHTATGKERTKVVPLALVSLLTGLSLKEAGSCLELQPIIREAVGACLPASMAKT
ncbi:glucokinase regulatory protein isoform X2 [Dunckerocampus dactyliophorus]|uniref:glucokinase regulatory protein isoform X2 n=2 Tax=Dunckerocampus dactyliophorus TaxID=161453 RepID=UPI002404FF9A|nr:glucokinase regulatory protein isoform X2 [Dunckerocampus dactyliophorus]